MFYVGYVLGSSLFIAVVILSVPYLFVYNLSICMLMIFFVGIWASNDRRETKALHTLTESEL